MILYHIPGEEELLIYYIS